MDFRTRFFGVAVTTTSVALSLGSSACSNDGGGGGGTDGMGGTDTSVDGGSTDVDGTGTTMSTDSATDTSTATDSATDTSADTGTDGGTTCPPDTFGPDCEPCTCVNGTCDDTEMGTGACTCDGGWSGADCDVCAGADQCGASCCGASEACVFGACVAAATACTSNAGCANGEICDARLGTPAAQCPATDTGKCIPAPPACTGTNDPVGCTTASSSCDVPPLGAVNSKVRWQWGYDPAPSTFVGDADVWSTPVVGRVHDSNCDGTIDDADAPVIAFVSGNAETTTCTQAQNFTGCKRGILRALDGSTGEEIWSLDKAEMGSLGFAGTSVAMADVDGDGAIELVALTGEGKVAIVSSDGMVEQVSTQAVAAASATNFGWGGGVSVADADGDGMAEIAYGKDVYTMKAGTLAHLFTGTGGIGGINEGAALSYFANVTGDAKLELIAGNTIYGIDGSPSTIMGVPDGPTAIGDVTGDGKPELVLVSGGNLYVVDPSTTDLLAPAYALPGNGQGGPPALTDVDADGDAEVIVARSLFVSEMDVTALTPTSVSITTNWNTTIHALSSAQASPTTADMNRDGVPEVILSDECFVWIMDGITGDVLWVANTQSFNTNETAVVADIDGDGKSELAVVHNSANPNSWTCAHHTTGADGYPIWSPPTAGAYRGVTVYEAADDKWPVNRALQNQHAHSVTNICEAGDSFCPNGAVTGELPVPVTAWWTQAWSNVFRGNRIESGQLAMADATVMVQSIVCGDPSALTLQLRNVGEVRLEPGVEVGIYRVDGTETKMTSVTSTLALDPGQTEVISVPLMGTVFLPGLQLEARIDPMASVPFLQCTTNNDVAAASCG